MAHKTKFYLVLDAGTTNVKGFIFNERFGLVAKQQIAVNKQLKSGGRVEQNPAELVAASKKVLKKVFITSGLKSAQLVSFGMATRRRLWWFGTREPAALFIRQSFGKIPGPRNIAAAFKPKWRENGAGQNRSGPDSLFFGFAHGLDFRTCVPKAAALVRRGELRFGTVDSWLLWHLGARPRHLTDVTNASRTLLFNVRALEWDLELMQLFNIPAGVLLL